MSCEGDAPVFAFKITGENEEIALSFSGIKREFNLEESTDGMMLDYIAKGLQFIKAFRIGDPLPEELRTRKASWEVEPHHLELARNRLTVQLITWISGEEKFINNSSELETILEDRKIKNKINSALDKAALHLKVKSGNDGREQVLQRIENLANELAHIETLRELVFKVVAIRHKNIEFRNAYNHKMNMVEVIDSVARLLNVAVEDYGKIFAQLDANTSEIVSVMRNIETNIEYIRNTRDDLYARLTVWEPMFRRWEMAAIRRSYENEILLRDTYSFLAPRFMQKDEWILFSALNDRKTSHLDTRFDWGIGNSQS